MQARLQRDIAWFNPVHEDNYYIGAAILPWNGELDAAQYVLRRASDARTFDWYPLFHYSFLFYHFRKDPATGAQWLLKGVPRVTNQQDEWALQNLAVAWETPRCVTTCSTLTDPSSTMKLTRLESRSCLVTTHFPTSRALPPRRASQLRVE